MSAADARTSDKICERIGISSYEIQRHPISPFYAANGRRASGKGADLTLAIENHSALL
jgi:hypothetical protein